MVLLLLPHFVASVFNAEPQCRRIMFDPDHRNAALREFCESGGCVFLGEHESVNRRRALYVLPRTLDDVPRLREAEVPGYPVIAASASGRVEVGVGRRIPLRQCDSDIRALPQLAGACGAQPQWPVHAPPSPVAQPDLVDARHFLGGQPERIAVLLEQAALAAAAILDGQRALQEVTEIQRPVAAAGNLPVEETRPRRWAADRCCRCAGRRAARSVAIDGAVSVLINGFQIDSMSLSMVRDITSAGASSPRRSQRAGSGANCMPSQGRNGSSQPSAGSRSTRSPQYLPCIRARPRTPVAACSTVSIGRVASLGDRPRER